MSLLPPLLSGQQSSLLLHTTDRTNEPISKLLVCLSHIAAKTGHFTIYAVLVVPARPMDRQNIPRPVGGQKSSNPVGGYSSLSLSFIERERRYL